MNMPKDEKELNQFFLLMELYEAKKRMDLPMTMRYPYQDFDKGNYEEAKAKYLESLK